MKIETGEWGKILNEQWRRMWALWEALIQAIPVDEWTKGESGFLTPVRHLIHTLDCVHVFINDFSLEDYDPSEWYGAKLEGNPFEIPTEILWSKETALEKLAATRQMVQARLAALTDESLLAQEKLHPWTGQTRLEKMLYVLRHTQHHLGAVEIEMSRRGINANIWEKEKANIQGSKPWW